MRVYAELYLSVMGALSVMGVYTLVSQTSSTLILLVLGTLTLV
jgi:hypothetical protein